MKNKHKEQWYKLYELTQEIGNYTPWRIFRESDCFSYIWKDKSKTVFFSFIGESIKKYGIACYIGESNYIQARKRLTEKNAKNEPVFMLQNALICLWDDRKSVPQKSYEIIRELGFKFRGAGAWLHFEKYEIGYLPAPPDEDEITLLITAFENLFMMVKAIYEDRLDPEFNKGYILLRWYEPKDKLYYTHPFRIDIPNDIIPRTIVTVHENDLIKEIRLMQSSGYSVEMDWSYLDMIFITEDKREAFPLLLLAVDRKSGTILASEFISPDHNKPDIVINTFDHLLKCCGKPSEIIINDPDLNTILEDICKKVGIKLTTKKQLTTIRNARKEIIDMM